jgi:hypothetical protein
VAGVAFADMVSIFGDIQSNTEVKHAEAARSRALELG